jgi:hypothetical protein
VGKSETGISQPDSKAKMAQLNVDFKNASVFTPTLGVSGHCSIHNDDQIFPPRGPRRSLNETDREVSRESFSAQALLSERTDT